MEITLNNASLKINPFTQPGVPDELCDKLRLITHLHTDKEHRNKGEATALLKQVIKESSEAGISLLVEPRAYEDDGLTTKQLIAFYAKHGFVQIQIKPCIMVRYATKL
jgi:GNAT superfamily N-acetyltransferase